ncbi:hypothetical protein [Jiangella aurantiaca]|uniref:hypothetical protein n=1 Tax=Jiangella aurantiaca TaxID=2530373 RepID=UPI00193D11A6|nr:hypothetical protein [Jiangella aurantiaca]
MLEEVFRDEWGRVLASLVGFLGDIDRAEEAAQEAFAIAAARWPETGAPANPAAWLVTTAHGGGRAGAASLARPTGQTAAHDPGMLT